MCPIRNRGRFTIGAERVEKVGVPPAPHRNVGPGIRSGSVMDDTEKPLSGIRVLELASVWAMPGAGMYLADQGADVVKIEPPGGEIGRTIAMTPSIKGQSRAFWSLNRNKRSVVIDLKAPDGIELIRGLARQTDVLIHNFRPGVDERLGIDYERLAQENPRLVYVAYNAFGPKGPRRTARGYDLLVQAATGIAMRRTETDGSPQPIGIFAVDMASSILAGYAVMLALFKRERTGKGQKVTGSLLQTGLALQIPEAVRVAEFPEPPLDGAVPRPAVFSHYQCADGRYVQISVASDAEWRSLCNALDAPELIDDPALQDSAGRISQSERLRPLLVSAFAARSAEDWQTVFDEHDCPGAMVETPESVFDSVQAQANDAFVEVAQPGIGTASILGVPFSLSQSPPDTFAPAPELGEHTDEVLGELGLDADAIARLRTAKTIA